VAGRLSTLILVSIVSFTLSYYVLASYYAPLTSWLAPYYGSDIYFIFGFFFLFMGNPLTYSILIYTTVILGVTIGILSRKVSRAIMRTISVYLFTGALMVGITVAYSISSLSLGSSGSPFPFSGTGSSTSFRFLGGGVPSGTNIATILGEPVFMTILDQILHVISTITATGSAGMSYSSLALMILPFFYGTIISMILCAVTASVVAYVLRKYVVKPDMPVKPVKPAKKAGPAAAIFAILMVIALSISGIGLSLYHNPGAGGSSNTGTLEPFLQLNGSDQESLVHAGIAGALNSSADVPVAGLTRNLAYVTASSSVGYTEAMLNLVSKYGNLYTMYAMMNSKSYPQSGTTGFSQVDASVLISFSNASMLMSKIGFSGSSNTSLGPFGNVGSSLASLIPPEILIVEVSNGSYSPGQVAAAQAAYYSDVTGTNLMLLFSSDQFSGSLGISGFSGNFYVYIGGSQLSSFSSKFSSDYLSGIQSSGLINVLGQGLNSGFMYSGNGYNPSGALIATGYWNLNGLNTILPGGGVPGLGTLLGNGSKLSFVIGLSEKSGFVTGTQPHSVTWGALDGVSSSFNFATSSALSMAGVIYPQQSSNYTFSGIASTYNATITTTNSTMMKSVLNATKWSATNVSAGYSFSPSSGISFNAALPPALKFTRSVVASGNSVTVTTAVLNDGPQQILNVSLRQAPVEYSGVASNSVYSNATSLAVGKSISVTYTFSVSNPGTYVIPAPTFSFNDPGYYYDVPYTNAQFSGAQPPEYLAVVTLVSTYVHAYVTRFVSLTSLEVELLSILLIVLAVLASVYSQVRAYKKWKRTKAQKRVLPDDTYDRGEPPGDR
jgi:hypothetical protein